MPRTLQQVYSLVFKVVCHLPDGYVEIVSGVWYVCNMMKKKKDDDNSLQRILGRIYKTYLDPSQYTGVPQDKGGKSKPGYKSNYQSTPSPSKSTQSSFGTPITPPVPKKKKKGKGSGGSSGYVQYTGVPQDKGRKR
jgi:hypothetical protein